MTNSTKDMIDLVDVSNLKLTLGHPNGTLAKITHVGNLKLNNDVILFNVLVVPEYTVSLLYVHKLIKDRKLSVGFDETKCYIYDLRNGRVLGTGNEMNPYDDEEELSGRDGSVHQPDTNFGNQARHDDYHTSTPIGENTQSKGTLGLHQEVPVVNTKEVPVFENMFHGQIEEASLGLRRSSRSSKFPAKLNEYVLENKVKYVLNRYPNHIFLSAENYCFVSNLNKSSEPFSFEEASKDLNWVNDMNDEMHALYEK
ncbi:hypothetical protein Tco_1256130 [Tanacetum coccineum]